MDDDELPPEVARFVLDWTPTVVHLEALILLHARPNDELSAEAVSAQLCVRTGAALAALRDLAARGLLSAATVRGPFRYTPRSPEMEAAVDRVAEAHRTHLVPLSRFIHAHENLRSVHDFANAFRFRKD